MSSAEEGKAAARSARRESAAGSEVAWIDGGLERRLQ
jgi:hypothetical protein